MNKKFKPFKLSNFPEPDRLLEVKLTNGTVHRAIFKGDDMLLVRGRKWSNQAFLDYVVGSVKGWRYYE